MSLVPGTKLGPYVIDAPIGAGGMGEVYRARDERLERDVAIKVLPAGVAGDPGRRARFEREARAVAALSHPNILAIHDIGEGESFLYAVTELLDGHTLRERLTDQGALPVRKAIEIAIQIARGLSAAHDKGLVHRDLKPENVFLLKDGQVKILDFGLARQSADTGLQTSATRTVAALTDVGTVMGTVGYMAPEQVRGQAVDQRTDLFALGAVLYETLSGQRAFRRDTAAETMTAILREEPPELSASRTELSPALERIVRHCLEKDPAQRFQSARDVAFALEAFSGTSITGPAIIVSSQARRSWVTAAAMAGIAIAGLAAGYFLNMSRTSESAPGITFDTRTWDAQWITNARFGPDGETIVYSAAVTGNVPDLFVIRQGTSIPQPLGQPRTHLLSVSKTGELAVLTNATYMNHRLFAGTLTRMTMDGAARPLMENVREADWSPNGNELAIIHDLGDKDRLEYPTGTTLYEVGGGYISDPSVSPDGSRVAFMEHQLRYDDRGWLKVVDRSGTVTTLAGEFWGGEGVAWSPDGATLFFSSAGPAGSGYYPQVVNVNGPPKPRPAFPSIVSAETMDIAPDGRMLVDLGEIRLSIRALLPGESVEREFPWLDLPLAADLSDDGKWLLFSDEGQSAGQNYAVALRKTDGTPAVRLGEGIALALSPDGKWAIGNIPSPGPERIVLYPTGPGQPKPLDLAPVTGSRNFDWLDDERIFLCGAEPGQPRRCYTKAVSGGPLQAVTPAGTTKGWTARDGRTILIGDVEGHWHVIDLANGQTRAVPGEHDRDIVLGWSQDKKSVFVRSSTAVPLSIERIDLAAGTRTRVRELMPPDRAGVMTVIPGRIVDDGRAYSYSYWRQLTRAVVVSGVSIGH
jgi:hypothetical protein